MQMGSLKKERGIENFSVPNFEDVKNFAIKLHSHLPYFDWIGWDIAIDENGAPMFIEFNVTPFCEGPQMVDGPIFGDLIDEVMERVKSMKEVNRFYYGHVVYDTAFSRTLDLETKWLLWYPLKEWIRRIMRK